MTRGSPWFHPFLPRVLTSSLSLSLLTSIAGSLLPPWQPPAQPLPFSAVSPFCSNHSWFERRFRQGHRNCSSWTERLGSTCWGWSWGKPCCRGWPALQLLSMDKARQAGKFQPAPSHPIILFWLKQTYLWPYSPPRMQSQHLRNAAASESRKPEWGNQCCRSESEQELQTFSKHHVPRAVPGLTLLTQSLSLALGRKVTVAQEMNAKAAVWIQQSNKCPTSATATRPFLPSGRFVSDLISAELDISLQNR